MADYYTLKENLTKIIQKSQYFFTHFSKIWGYFTLSTYLICKLISKTLFFTTALFSNSTWQFYFCNPIVYYHLFLSKILYC